MSEPEDLLQIGEFAKLAESNLRTLRYYEELGLLKPAKRSEGGFRLYARSQLERMAAIKRLQDLGLPLKEIADAIGTQSDDTGTELLQRLQVALEKQISLLGDKIEKMQKDLDGMNDARRRLTEMCQHCELPFSPNACDPCPRDQQPIPAMLRALL